MMMNGVVDITRWSLARRSVGRVVLAKPKPRGTARGTLGWLAIAEEAAARTPKQPRNERGGGREGEEARTAKNKGREEERARTGMNERRKNAQANNATRLVGCRPLGRRQTLSLYPATNHVALCGRWSVAAGRRAQPALAAVAVVGRLGAGRVAAPVRVRASERGRRWQAVLVKADFVNLLVIGCGGCGSGARQQARAGIALVWYAAGSRVVPRSVLQMTLPVPPRMLLVLLFQCLACLRSLQTSTPGYRGCPSYQSKPKA